jgi:hypothetical protein
VTVSVQASYLSASSPKITQVACPDATALDRILDDAAKGSANSRGAAVELVGQDGSVLVIAPTERGITLLWTDPLGSSFHSVGPLDDDSPLAFDYLGHYSEVPLRFVVIDEQGRSAARAYVENGSPFIPSLTLEPDW